MSERTKAIIASAAVILVVAGVDVWLARLGAWGPVVYATVLGAVVVWLLAANERHPVADDDDEVFRRRNLLYEV